jgi:hypothetical protein
MTNYPSEFLMIHGIPVANMSKCVWSVNRPSILKLILFTHHFLIVYKMQRPLPIPSPLSTFSTTNSRNPIDLPSNFNTTQHIHTRTKRTPHISKAHKANTNTPRSTQPHTAKTPDLQSQISKWPSSAGCAISGSMPMRASWHTTEPIMLT